MLIMMMLFHLYFASAGIMIMTGMMMMKTMTMMTMIIMMSHLYFASAGMSQRTLAQKSE